ncbi:uncharacterized protein LOC107262380 [Ricinus communis]|uniref:uncharacterized protein LOC107262380 n=1 Tax=Ricinus communis TaxID=3988 RepID=UPI0007722F10|nr:uncharacterized protein LOC107262380 [Ricinus communis]|eukprot:XP_015583316.1 uncharacterized protein LOC107262380 [Ricinus communis]
MEVRSGESKWVAAVFSGFSGELRRALDIGGHIQTLLSSSFAMAPVSWRSDSVYKSTTEIVRKSLRMIEGRIEKSEAEIVISASFRVPWYIRIVDRTPAAGGELTKRSSVSIICQFGLLHSRHRSRVRRSSKLSLIVSLPAALI